MPYAHSAARRRTRAARGGYLYTIQLLVAHDADPTITDSQGYNSLHLVTHSSGVMLLLYLLHQLVGVNSRDAQGHTALMWAAYQGDALSLDLLLWHGASPTIQDDAAALGRCPRGTALPYAGSSRRAPF